jgi:hypothetical protein
MKIKSQIKFRSAWKLAGIGMCSTFLLMSCGTAPQVEKTMTDKEQVIEFVRKVRNASLSGKLADESFGMRQLNLRKEPYLLNKGTIWERTGLRYLTGIPILDTQDEKAGNPGGVTYRVPKNGGVDWHIGIGELGKRICMTYDDMVKLMGPPNSSIAPRRGQSSGAASLYIKKEKEGEITISFWYVNDRKSEPCVNLFTAAFQSTK